VTLQVPLAGSYSSALEKISPPYIEVGCSCNDQHLSVWQERRGVTLTGFHV
jgi:hypothetical protein